jgi:segregation and condensation protein B
MKIYSTTEKFQKYFGVQGGKDALKQKLFSKVRNIPQPVQTIESSTPASPAA